MRRGRAMGALCCLALGCAGAAREADRPFQEAPARVESLEILLQADPRPVLRAVARGTLADSCTRLERESRERRGSRIQVTLTTRRESRSGCIAEPRPFARTLVLSTSVLPAGLYTLEVNGLTAVFDLPRRPDLDPVEDVREPDLD